MDQHSARRILDAAARSSLSIFFQKAFQIASAGDEYEHNWHIDVSAYHLQEAFEKWQRGEPSRLIITQPPRSSKSLLCSVAFPAWALGHKPTTKFICGSTNKQLATKHSTDCRTVIGSEFYQNLFPTTRIAHGENLKQYFATSAGGYRLATSARATVIGQGANFVVIDDPHDPSMSTVKVEADIEWARQLTTRLNSKKRDSIVVNMQRLRHDDLIGYLEGKGGWKIIHLPAEFRTHRVYEYKKLGIDYTHEVDPGDVLQEIREPHNILRMLKGELGDFIYTAQYLLEPVPAEGGIFKEVWFKEFEHYPVFEAIVQSWDTAVKEGELNDYSVCTTWGMYGNLDFLIDFHQERMTYPALKRKAKELAVKHRPNKILIEDASSGASLIQDLQQETDLPVVAVPVSRDKVTRAQQAASRFDTGRVLMPKTAHWTPIVKAQLMSFPNAAHDDIVDSCTTYLNWRPSARAGDNLATIKKIIQQNSRGAAPAW